MSSATMRVNAFGVYIGIRFDGVSARLIEDAQGAWSRCMGPRAVEPRQWFTATYGEHASVEMTTKSIVARTDRELHELVVGEITRAAIRFRAGGPLLIHAAAVEVEPGKVHAFVAKSGTGKTTLAATLGSRYGYVTDETLVVDPRTLEVTAYPKPLCIATSEVDKTQPSQPDVRPVPRAKAVVGPDELGLHAVTQSQLRLSALSFIEREEGEPVAFTNLAPLEALMRLGMQTSALSAYQRPLVRLRGLIENVPHVAALRYSEAAELAPGLARITADC